MLSKGVAAQTPTQNPGTAVITRPRRRAVNISMNKMM
jgi:hypothetical protein